jgi:DNA polymerase-3 subunit epsilon
MATIRAVHEGDMYLFFDTETSGLPRDYRLPPTALDNWPRIVQIAWMACDGYSPSLKPTVHLIRPVGFTISHGSCQKHGISTEFAMANGVPLPPILGELLDAVQAAEVLVAHNIDFDAAVVGAEFLRAGLPNPIPMKQSRCTMKQSTKFCKLPGNYGYKWPTLDELHRTLFQSAFDGAHDAGADCLACVKCFFRLRELNAIP